MTAWRSVEAQHVVSTRRLVDDAGEQEVLEELIEAGKPPVPSAPEHAGLHYLLSTSFRYPPLRHGSRFATRNEPSLWYGAAAQRPMFAEVAYYRLLFLEGTTAQLEPIEADLSVFRVPVRTRRGVDLTKPPFDAFQSRISSPSTYRDSQRLGGDLREAGVEAFRYASARDREGGTNVAAFTPKAFGARSPDSLQTWHSRSERAGVELVRLDALRRERFEFPRSDFLVRGRLPSPAP